MPRANIVALAARAKPGNTGGDDDGLNGLKPRPAYFVPFT